MWRGLANLLKRDSLERMGGPLGGWRADKGVFGARQTRAQTLALSVSSCDSLYHHLTSLSLSYLACKMG